MRTAEARLPMSPRDEQHDLRFGAHRLLPLLGFTLALAARASAQAGSLDTTFGLGGKVTTDFFSSATHEEARAVVAVQSDQKVVVAGTRSAGNGDDFALARYSANGALDPTFGDGGKVATDFGNGRDNARALVLQPDGRIIAVGRTTNAVSGDDFALARYNPDGSLDTSFGSGGLVETHVAGADEAWAAALQSDGRIVVAGFTYVSPVNGYDFALARYLPDGSLDATFGVGGTLTTSLGAGDWAYGVAVGTNGRIAVAGFTSTGSTWMFALACYNPDGSLDLGFDSDGWTTTSFGSTFGIAHTVAIQADGRIVVAGYSQVISANGHDFALARFNPDGSLDPSFDSDGRVTTHHGTSLDYVYGIVLLSDGKMLAAGRGGQGFALARYHADGSLDLGFDLDGKVTTSFSGASEAYSVAIQSTGKVVAAGRATTSTGGRDFALARYSTTGALDTTFGASGKVITNFGGPATNLAMDMVAMQADGKILVAGDSLQSNATVYDFALARYQSNGSLDGTFGSGGRVTTHIGTMSDHAGAVAIQPDGRVVVAGRCVTLAGSWDFALARYNNDGSLDGSFGAGGKVTTHFGSDDGVEAVAIQPDGKIVVAGYVIPLGAGVTRDFGLARYHANGSLDTTFGGSGKVTTDFGGHEYAYALAIQVDGKLIVAGTSLSGGSGSFALARLNPDGSLDSSFGTGGKVTTDFGGPGDDWCRALALQVDGRIVVAGDTFTSTGARDFALARYSADGSLDLTFGDQGMVTTDFGASSADYALAVALQADGRIVAAGSSDEQLGSAADFALARYDADGSLDTSFGVGGLVTTDFEQNSDRAHALVQQAGMIVLAGSATTSAGGQDFGMARYQGYTNPIELVEALVQRVEDHAAEGVLNHGRARSLEAKLEAAILQLDRDNEATAIHQLHAFLNEIEAFVSASILTAAEGQALYDSAAYIVHLLLTS